MPRTAASLSVLAAALVVSGALTATAAAAPAGIPSTAADESPAALLARAREAAGGKAWDGIAASRQRAKLRAGGLEGVTESVVELRTGRFVDRFTLGPTSGADGFDGKTVWSQDTAGQPRAEDSEDARLGAVDESYRDALGFWSRDRWPAEIVPLGHRTAASGAATGGGAPTAGTAAGRDLVGLRITPRGGRPFELWIDAASGLADHVVEAGATETRTTFLTDYREVGGVKVPFRQLSTNGDSRYDQVLEVESITWNEPVAEAAFGMPAPPPPDFSLAGGATSTTVPFQLLNNHIYVDVKLDGKGPFRVLCDTGGINIVTPRVARTLGVAPQGALQGGGVGDQSTDIGMVKLTTLEIGGATLRGPLFAVFDLDSLAGAEGVEENGLIGYEVFKRFVVRVDYQHRTLTLTLPTAFAYHGSGVVVPFKFNEHIPQVEGSIDGIAGKFDIDTGSRAGIDLLGPFVEQNGLRQRYAPKLQGVSGWGVGGAARSQFARAGSLRLGGLEIAHPIVELSLQTKGAFSDKYVAGNVGGALLSHYDVTFDYSRQQIVFERRAGSDQPIAFDRAGLWLNQAGAAAFEVIDVYAGSPAAEAGLRPGDRVVQVDGKSPAELPLAALRERLRGDPPGTRLRFTVERDGQRREVVVALRDLI
jgi:hypothetical protein